MEFKPAKTPELTHLAGKHAIIIISNGQTKVAELPEFGTVEITSHEGKVTFVEEKTKEKF